jgi:phage gpG-like protein
MITGRIDLRATERGIRDLLRRADRVGPFFHALLPALRQDQRDHVRQRQGPAQRWPTLSSATVAKQRAKRKRTRKLLGRLTTAVQYRAGADAARATSRVRWSGIHQDGGRAGQGAEIPARPFLWLSEDFLDDATGALLDYVARNWPKRR